VAPRQCRRIVGKPPLCWWHSARTILIALARKRLARNGPEVHLDHRTRGTVLVHRAVQSVAEGIGLSFGFASQFLDRVYRKVEQFNVGIVVAVYLVCIVGVQRG